MDGDGDLDALITNQAAPNRIWLNDGTGIFSDGGSPIGAGQQHQSGILGDLDKDGDLDAFIASGLSTPTQNIVWFNVHGLDTGDLDNDGIPNNFELAENTLSPNDPADADMDGDDDGASAYEEYLADTDIEDANSVFNVMP